MRTRTPPSPNPRPKLGPLDGYGPNPERDYYRAEVNNLRDFIPADVLAEYDRLKDSGATPRNTPVGSRGATSGNPAPERDQHAEQSAAVAKRTEKTADRGTDLESGRDRQTRGAGSDGAANISAGALDAHSEAAEYATGPPLSKPRKRTVGSISVPELPWKRGQ